MRTIRPGGVYLLMPHGECFSKQTQGPPCLSAHPKPGVRQLNYVTGPDFEAHALQGLDEMAALFDVSAVASNASHARAGAKPRTRPRRHRSVKICAESRPSPTTLPCPISLSLSLSLSLLLSPPRPCHPPLSPFVRARVLFTLPLLPLPASPALPP